jgi:beta-glucanase (GH16 family)
MHTSTQQVGWAWLGRRAQPGRQLLQLALLIPLLLLGLASSAWAQCEQLVWKDEFDGTTIDPTKWEREVNGTGQGTGQLDYATDRPQNAYLENGNLVLKLIKEEYGGMHYTSARLRTYKKLDTQYGRIEARVKGVYSQGNGFAFWMLGSDYETVTWPKCGEIDIFENTGKFPGHNIGTAHFAGPTGQDAMSQGSYDLPAGQRWADDYHVTGIEWSPTYIKWYIDGKVYHTLDLTQPLSGYRPFNRPFFVLLSIGMGGGYSGPPDATTVTPMTATIDYVRVYKGAYSTAVSGDEKVYKGEQNKQYSVTTTADASNTYAWTVPAGARILSGQGSPSINVDWGQVAGPVSVQIKSSCNATANTYSLNVGVEEPFVADKVLESFESPPAFTYTTVSGTFTKGVPNPQVGAVNPSAKVGKYIRNSGAQYDVLGLQGVDAQPAGDFVTGQRRVLLDVYSDAPPGTRVSLNFENSKVANAGNYPSGRYANFEAVTTKQNQWETLEFAYVGTPDQYAGASDVDQWILMFAPVTYTGNVFYFDNLRTGQPGGTPRTLDSKVLQNFDGTSLLTLDTSPTGTSGTYTVGATPAPAAPNTSANAAKYVRNAGQQYDALVYRTTAITDGRPFRLGTSRLALDMYTDAPVGTKLSLNFEISTIATGGNYPSGRYATFEAVTTKQNQWETLTFSLSLKPDAGASDAAIDKLVFLFNPVTNTSNTYYIDNIRINSTAPKENLVLASTWLDYDATNTLTLKSANGTYSPGVANPAPAAPNTSAKVAQYVRNATAQYDAILFNKNTAAIDPGALKNRTQRIAIDVYTSAPAGTPITVGLDASSLETPTNYPTGRHSNYQATTTVQNAWHTIYFTLGGQPDTSAPDSLVDTFAVLFESGASTGTTYYFDNIRVVNVVPQPTLTSLVVTPALSQNVATGQKIQYAVQGKDQFGANIAAGTVTWSVSGGGSIDANGLFTASTNGAFKVSAKASGLTSTADVLVGQGVGLATISVDPSATFVYQGGSLPLTVRGYDQTGAPVTVTPTWTTTGATGVAVSSTGVVTASSTALGTAAVKATSGNLSATATITVRTPAAADTLAISPVATKVYQGDVLQFTAKALDQYRNPIAASPTWTVSGGGSIDASGLFTSTTIGSFVVKVQAGSAVASTYVSVVPKPANLALNKPTRASSTQGTLVAAYTTDGTPGRTTPDTRWASADTTSNQWLRVDLGARYDLSRVVLNWENAYGKVYKIQVADDTVQARRQAYYEPAGNGDVDDLTLATGTYGRYVWMTGIRRGSPYGYSLYEMQVYGMPHQDPALKAIVVTPNFSTLAAGKSVTFAAASLDQFGNAFAATPTWTTTGGTITSTGVFSAPAAGTYTITASAGGVSGAANITVTNSSTPPPASPNLSLNKPARASSVENGGTLPAYAVDGNATTTRWASQSTDAQWLRVDLGATYTLNRVKITWETALGKDYAVQISADTVNWTPLKTVTGNTALVNDWTGLNGTGRYLRISGTARGTGYGYSIYELEAYGAGSGGTSNQAPTVALTSPAAKATFTGLAPITLTASAADADGTVGKVEFYAGSTLVGTDSSSPYSVSWTPAVGGTYALTAKATDNAGATTTSVEVSVTVTAATASGQLIPGTIEAESYSAMSGVATETTADTNGGQNVGYIDSSDWLDYAVNVQTAGTYTVQLRVAGFSPTAQLQLKAGNTVLATVNVPNTNGGQNWTTATATISLPAGSQTLRVAVVNGGFNFNWMSFNSGATARTSSALATQAGAAEASDATLAVYPNPAATTVQLSGVAAFPATVAIYDLKGALLQSAQVAQPSDVLSVAELAAGWYVLRVTSKGAVQIQRLLKQ